MKVPYLKEKRRKEMIELAGEFSAAISSNLSAGSLAPRLHAGWLNSLHSVFALLQILNSSNNSINPSREFALIGAKRLGDSGLFLEAMTSFQASAPVMREMRSAYSDSIFSGFIAELKSDMIMMFINSLIYSYRGAAISLRCALEDLYRHLYYMDHPQEFAALQEGREVEYSMGLSPLKLREYLRRASYLQCFSTVRTDFAAKNPDDKAEMDLFGLNEKLYASLSSAVHGASEDWFASLSNALSLRYSHEKEDKMANLVSGFSKMSVSFLISAHRDIVAAAGDYDKSIVLDIFSDKERADFRKLLNI